MEFGADPVAGGINSGFLLACRKGNARAVRRMLKKMVLSCLLASFIVVEIFGFVCLQGGSDIQPGLSIAKELGHHWVVGLLLRHAFLKSKYCCFMFCLHQVVIMPVFHFCSGWYVLG